MYLYCKFEVLDLVGVEVQGGLGRDDMVSFLGGLFLRLFVELVVGKRFTIQEMLEKILDLGGNMILFFGGFLRIGKDYYLRQKMKGFYYVYIMYLIYFLDQNFIIWSCVLFIFVFNY